jgi:hypothetical protein
MRVESDKVFGLMENFEKMLAKGKDDMIKAKDVINHDKEMPASGKEFLGGLASAYDNLADAVELFGSVLVDLSKRKEQVFYRPGTQTTAAGASAAVAANKAPPKPQPSPEEVKKKKFVSAVKDAEKSLLVFGLDLGKVQIMNTTTIAKNVTQDVVRKAAATESKNDGRPSEETVAILDDTLSMVTGMDFFGKVTKPYQNKRDVNDVMNGKFCTLPVKLNFKSKEAKAHAEAVLRKNCGIRGTTPMPQRLRKLIGKTIADHKVKFPGCFIQAKVDTDTLTIKMSRRNDKKEWTNNYDSVEISMAAMDLEFVRNGDNDMEVSQSQTSL